MDNPFQLTLGTEQYGQYLGASTMNHVLIYGLPALHALIGLVYSRIRRVPVWDGFVWVRFPSLSLLPLQYLIETTAQSATTVAIFAVTIRDRAIAGISLCLAVTSVTAFLVYLIRTWGPQYSPGVNPVTLERRSKKKTLLNPCFPRRPGVTLIDDGVGENDQWIPIMRTQLKLIVQSILFFIDGDVSWKDSKNCRSGYCRASRLLFMDYTPSAYWFMSVELGVAFLMGILGGIKFGTCDTVAIAILVVLVLFLVVILVLQPYNTAFGTYFNILVTILQVLGAAFAVIVLSRGGADQMVYQERSELMSIVELYLMVGKAVLDLLPKFRDLIVYLYLRGTREGLGLLPQDKVESPTTHSASLGPGGTHSDLTEKLLQTIQASSAADSNCISASNVVTIALPQEQDEENDEFQPAEDTAVDLMFSLPPLPAHSNSHREVENWGYEWDESALGLHVPTRRDLFGEDDDRDGLSVLKQLRPRDSSRGGEGKVTSIS
jgi:hypothetical protein